jgi:hypothetical protein
VTPPSGATRAERRVQQGNGDAGSGGRRGLIIGGVVAAVLLLGIGAAFALGVFSGGGGDEEAAPVASTNVDLEPGELQVFWPGLGPTATPEDLPDQVMGVIGEYVDNGIVPGLRTGKVKDADLGTAFDQAALAKLAGEDRAVLLDEGLPKAVGKLTITSTAPTNFTVLNDAQGASLVVTAALDLDVRVRSAKGPYDIKRTGQLELVPNGSGGWVITGWDIDVSRTGNGLTAAQQTPTTTAVTTATTVVGAP